MNQMKERKLWIRSLCTDADAKAYAKANQIQGNLPDGTLMVSTRDFAHKKKNLRKLCEQNAALKIYRANYKKLRSVCNGEHS